MLRKNILHKKIKMGYYEYFCQIVAQKMTFERFEEAKKDVQMG